MLVLAALLLASLAGNALLARALKDAFAQLHGVRNFPLGFVPREREVLGPAGARSIAIWGDSRAQMWDKAALASTLRVFDHAHGGMTSSQLVLQLASEAAEPSDIALAQFGINDLHPLGALAARKPVIVARLQQNLAAVRDALLARSGVVVLSTIVPPGRVPLARRPMWDDTTLDEIAAANDRIRAMADGRRVLVLDAHALLRGDGGWLEPRYQDDDFFLHLNPAAYARLNQALLDLLAQRPAPRS